MISFIAYMAWPTLMWICQVWVGVRYHERLGKGRILTRPLWRIPWFRPTPHYFFGELFYVSYGSTRVKQLLCLLVPLFAQLMLLILGTIPDQGPWPAITFNLVVICLYLDDYVTGDDENWRRFRDWAKNKVKWRMELPRTQEQV